MAREEYEAEGLIKPEIGSDGRKSYSLDDIELGKELGRPLNKYKEAGLPSSDAHEMAVEAVKQKKIQGNLARRKTVDPSKIKTHHEFKGLLGIAGSAEAHHGRYGCERLR